MGRDTSEEAGPGLKVSVVDIEEGIRTPKAKKNRLRRFIAVLRRTFSRNDSGESPWPRIVRHIIYLLTAALALAAITIMYEYPSLF